MDEAVPQNRRLSKAKMLLFANSGALVGIVFVLAFTSFSAAVGILVVIVVFTSINVTLLRAFARRRSSEDSPQLAKARGRSSTVAIVIAWLALVGALALHYSATH